MVQALARLRKELKKIRKSPVENIEACPKESNLLEWHYVITGRTLDDFSLLCAVLVLSSCHFWGGMREFLHVGPSDSPYVGGYYHGVVRFPQECEMTDFSFL